MVILNREFLVYNVIDENAMTFISKVSWFGELFAAYFLCALIVLCQSISIDGYASSNDTVRAINTFALQFEELPRQCDARLGECSTKKKQRKGVPKEEALVLVKSYDYADILIDPVLTYYINADTFYQQLFDRMLKHLANV